MRILRAESEGSGHSGTIPLDLGESNFGIPGGWGVSPAAYAQRYAIIASRNKACLHGGDTCLHPRLLRPLPALNRLFSNPMTSTGKHRLLRWVPGLCTTSPTPFSP